MNEMAARKLTRKHPFKCISYSKDHLVRTYPAGRRIDSSNFNPIHFWAYGIQMAALNFQTQDVFAGVNAAMFEQSGSCGYTLKPRVLWDEANPLYRKLNPMSKELVNYSALILTLHVISGQHVMPGMHSGSPIIEVEILGVANDSAKEKSKVGRERHVNELCRL